MSVTFSQTRSLTHGATRRALIVNLGGGMTTDLGGFAAACYMRGIRYVNIPTTLLACVDASAGGKTGVNLRGVKNIVGAFQMGRDAETRAAYGLRGPEALSA